jgi:hypothetical protein
MSRMSLSVVYLVAVKLTSSESLSLAAGQSGDLGTDGQRSGSLI